MNYISKIKKLILLSLTIISSAWCPENSPALLEVVLFGDFEQVSSLLSARADPNQVNLLYGRTPLAAIVDSYIAGRTANLALIRLLLENKANPDSAAHSGCTPLFLAIVTRRDNLELARLLLKHKAHPDPVNKEGDTPLRRAVYIGDRDALRLLLEHKADPNPEDNERGIPPLCMAVYNRDCKSVELLLNHLADPNRGNKFGKMPICCAVDQGCVKVVELLINSGASVQPNISLYFFRFTTPHFARFPESLLKHAFLTKEISISLIRHGAGLPEQDYEESPKTMGVYFPELGMPLDVIAFVCSFLAGKYGELLCLEMAQLRMRHK